MRVHCNALVAEESGRWKCGGRVNADCTPYYLFFNSTGRLITPMQVDVANDVHRAYLTIPQSSGAIQVESEVVGDVQSLRITAILEIPYCGVWRW